MNDHSGKCPRRFYGLGIPGVQLDELAGKLIVVEGADGWGAPRKSRGSLTGWRPGATPRSRWASNVLRW